LCGGIFRGGGARATRLRWGRGLTEVTPGAPGKDFKRIAEGATMTDVETALANCRALINQINAGLSAKEPFVDVSSATELIFYLERAASALKKPVLRS